MQQSKYSQLPGLSEVMAKRFQIIEDAISKGTLEKPKTSICNTYLWYANFKGEDRYRNFGINFSWGAFFLSALWYVHFGLIKEAFLITLILSIFIGLFPLDSHLSDFTGAASAAVFSMYFTGTRYAKYKITRSLNRGGNFFLTILITIGIAISVAIPTFIINGILYGWK